MIDSPDPYVPPCSKLASQDRWLLGFAVVYLSALAGIVCLYFVLERNYFADGTTDPVMFLRALPVLALVAFVPALISIAFRPRRVLSQLIVGLVLGPVFGCIALATYNIWQALLEA